MHSHPSDMENLSTVQLDFFQNATRKKRQQHDSSSIPDAGPTAPQNGFYVVNECVVKNDVMVPYKRVEFWGETEELKKQARKEFFSRGTQVHTLSFFLTDAEIQDLNGKTFAQMVTYFEKHKTQDYNNDFCITGIVFQSAAHVLITISAKNFKAHDHGFSVAAQKRLRDSLDNLLCTFESIHAIDKQLVAYNFQQKEFHRKPVFCTLTVPQQAQEIRSFIVDADTELILKNAISTRQPKNASNKAVFEFVKHKLNLPKTKQPLYYVRRNNRLYVRIGVTDYTVKEKFGELIDNLKKTYGLRLYVWKAEAQKRGAIHFHCLFDCFILESTVRKLWYNLLKRHQLVNENIPVHKSSRLVHFEMIKRVESMKFEILGYFAHHTDNNGNLSYKHNGKVKRKTYVREIEGNVWGGADALKYPSFKLNQDQMESELFADVVGNALDVVPVKDAEGKVITTMYIIKQCVLKIDGRFDSRNKVYTTEKTSLQAFEPLQQFYHYEKARLVYTDLPDLMKYEFNVN